MKPGCSILSANTPSVNWNRWKQTQTQALLLPANGKAEAPSEKRQTRDSGC